MKTEEKKKDTKEEKENKETTKEKENNETTKEEEEEEGWRGCFMGRITDKGDR